MSVLAQTTARADVLLRRGITNEWGIHCEHSSDNGGTFEPLSWAGWRAVLELRSVDGDNWLTLPVSLEAGGLARALVPADALTSSTWERRGSGTWSITAAHADGRVDRLGDGYFYLER